MDKLPDDLLTSIVSLLPAKERARTSVLAPRWRNFWKLLRVLNLDDSEITEELRYSRLGKKSILKRNSIRRRFVNCVNRALVSHMGETLDELRIKSGLDNNDAKAIDRWIELALRKKVRKLELNFNADTMDGRWNDFRFKTYEYLAYDFPNFDRFDVSPPGISLVSLSLNQVNLSEEALDSLISSCRNLEHLHVEMANGIKSFRPSCEATRLRRLALIGCNDLRNVEVCCPGLVWYELLSEYFKYTRTKLNGAPSLARLSLAAYSFDELVDRLLRDVSGCLSRLETLELHTVIVEAWEMPFECESLIGVKYEFPRLPQLRKLVLEIDKNVGGSILCFTPLMKSAPLLREVVLKLIQSGSGHDRNPERGEIEVGEKHECLKVMEIQGYVGKAVDVEMAVYVMDYAASLEKVVIDGVAHTGEDLHLLKAEMLEKFHVCLSPYDDEEYDDDELLSDPDN